MLKASIRLATSANGAHFAYQILIAGTREWQVWHDGKPWAVRFYWKDPVISADGESVASFAGLPPYRRHELSDGEWNWNGVVRYGLIIDDQLAAEGTEPMFLRAGPKGRKFAWGMRGYGRHPVIIGYGDSRGEYDSIFQSGADFSLSDPDLASPCFDAAGRFVFLAERDGIAYRVTMP